MVPFLAMSRDVASHTASHMVSAAGAYAGVCKPRLSMIKKQH